MNRLSYTSTRDNTLKIGAAEAVVRGLSQEGGLFVPERIPGLPLSLSGLAKLNYKELSYEIMKEFLTGFTEEELKSCIDRAYDEKFDDPAIAPLKEAGGTYYLELFHGPTIAFKDMALSILPHLMTTAAKKEGTGNDIVILTATSGDTGKAALSGFADVEGTRIIVFFPKDGVSPIQKRQMVTQKGSNVFVAAVEGNFDDCQSAVKRMFADTALKEKAGAGGFQFSSANSINIGRLVPQIVYYIYAYGQLMNRGAVREGEEINIVVPTGNFGNILAAYYAKNMGLPVKRLICASNENKVLYDFFRDGVYDKNRKFFLTSSPSMDILISSNLERLIYHICSDSAERNSELMRQLAEEGKYAITPQMKELLKDFRGYYASEEETGSRIASLFKETGYVIDPHTAVASASYEKYKSDTGDSTVSVIASTASPFKFSRSVLGAIEPGRYSDGADFELIDRLSELSGVAVPPAIDEIRNAPVLHKCVCEKERMGEVVTDYLLGGR